MRNILVVLFIFICACGFFRNDQEVLEIETTEAPEVVKSVEGGQTVVEYDASHYGTFNPNINKVPLKCSYSEETVNTTITIVDPVVSNVRVTKVGSHIIDLAKESEKGKNVGFTKNADYIHINGMTLSIEPDNFSNVDYAILRMKDGTNVMWFEGGHFNTAEMKYDGSINIKKYIDNNDLKVRYVVKASTPRETTKIRGVLQLKVFYDCEE